MKLIYQTYHTKKTLFVPADNFEKMLKEHRVNLGFTHIVGPIVTTHASTRPLTSMKEALHFPVRE